MLNLFRMDMIFFGKKPICNFILYILIVFVCMPHISCQILYVVLITMTATYMSSLIISREYINKPACMVNSLPITRKEIVISRYIGMIASVFIICIILTIFGVICKKLIFPINIEYIKISTVIIGAFYVIVVECLSYPFAFKLSSKKGQLIIDLFNCASLMIMIFFIAGNSEKIIYRVSEFVSENRLLIQGVCIISIVLMIKISILLSIKFYENRDL